MNNKEAKNLYINHFLPAIVNLSNEIRRSIDNAKETSRSEYNLGEILRMSKMRLDGMYRNSKRI